MHNILVLPGDGIGKEVSNSAVRLLEFISEKYEMPMTIKSEVFGGKSYDKYGDPCPDKLIESAKDVDAIFLGAVGHPKYDELPDRKKTRKRTS